MNKQELRTFMDQYACHILYASVEKDPTDELKKADDILEKLIKYMK